MYDAVTSARPASAFELRDGIVSDPLEQQDGIFIVKVVSAGPSFEESRARVEHEAQQHALRHVRAQWLARLRERTNIRLDPQSLAHVSRIRTVGLNGQICVRPPKR